MRESEFGPGLSLDLHDISLSGSLGRDGISEAALDLVDVGMAVYCIERSLPGAQSGNRPAAFHVDMPVRRPEAFTPEAVGSLQRLLQFQGDAQWDWKFSKPETSRPNPGARKLVLDDRESVDSVVLFSGGLDSTSGLSSIRAQAANVQLVAHYSRQKTRQQEIASLLGFKSMTQGTFTLSKESFRGRTFLYRSFYFLCLAAAVATSYGVRRIVQFENGILALAVPFGGAYFITRHAHPFMHRDAEALFGSVLGGTWAIENPFIRRTKREAVELMRGALGNALANEVIPLTETCWYVHSNQYVGKKKKKVGQPCGLCIPCLIRRTATRRYEGGFDIGDPAERQHIESALHFHQMDAFVSRIEKARAEPREFLLGMPSWVADIPEDASFQMDENELFDLLSRFGREFRETFADGPSKLS